MLKRLMDVGAVAGSRIVRQAAMVLVMAIAARLLGKELLGIWSLLYIVIQFGVLLSDSGISVFLIRHRDLNPRIYATGFYLSTAFSVLIAAVVAAIGIPVASLLGYREFAPYFVFVALAIVPLTISGLLQSKLRRDCRFNVIFFVDCIASGAMVLLATWMLMTGYQLWAIVVPTLLSAVLAVVGYVVFCGLPRFEFDRRDAKQILDYSLGLVGFSTVNYWSRNLDHVLIGKFLGAAPLGVYALAYRIMMLPLSQITATAQTVALPYMAPHQDDPERLRDLMHRMVLIVGMLTTLPMICIWLERELVVHLLLGPNWSRVADLLTVLAPLAVLQAFVSPIGICFQISGKTKKFFVVGVINTSVVVASFALGVYLQSIDWVVVCYAIANVLLVPLSVGSALKTIGSGMRDWLAWTLPFFACLPLSWAIKQIFARGESEWWGVGGTVLAASLGCLGTYLISIRTLQSASQLSS